MWKSWLKSLVMCNKHGALLLVPDTNDAL